MPGQDLVYRGDPVDLAAEFRAAIGTPEQRGLVQEGTIPFAGITKDSQAEYPPVPAPSVAPPAGPFEGQPAPQPQARPDWGARMQAIAPVLLAAISSTTSPRNSAAFLAGMLRGQELRKAQTEREDERQMRRQREAAEFTSRAIGELAQIDPAMHGPWLEMMQPIAAVYDVDLKPHVERMTVQAQSAKQKREAQALVDRFEKQYAGQNWSAKDETGALRSREWWHQRAGLPVATDQSGQALMRPAPSRTLGDSRILGDVPLDRQHAAAVASGDTELAAQIEDAMARQDATRRDPPRGGGGPSDAQAFSMSERLARSWTQASQPVKEMRRAYRLMETGLQRFRHGDKNGGSQAVLVTFQKVLDPTSVVRESEYARTTQGQSLLNRIEGYTTRLAQGGATLTDAEMADMVETGRQFLEGAEASVKGARQRIERAAARYRIDPALVFDDVLDGSAEGAPNGGAAPPTSSATTPTQTTTSGPAIGERRIVNGQLAEWDGKGWKRATPGQ